MLSKAPLPYVLLEWLLDFGSQPTSTEGAAMEDGAGGRKVNLGRLGFSTCAAAVVDHDLHMAINGFNWHLLVAVVIIPRSRCQSRHQEGGATHY